MIIKKKAGTVHWAKIKAYSRAAKITDAEIIAWVEVAGTAMSRALEEYRRTGLIEHLTDAQHGAEQVAGWIEAMVDRQGASLEGMPGGPGTDAVVVSEAVVDPVDLHGWPLLRQRWPRLLPPTGKGVTYTVGGVGPIKLPGPHCQVP